jgi:hypothetical protein
MENWNGQYDGCLCTECKCSKCVHLHRGECQITNMSFKEIAEHEKPPEKVICSRCGEETTNLYIPLDEAENERERIVLDKMYNKHGEVCKVCIEEGKEEAEKISQDKAQVKFK